MLHADFTKLKNDAKNPSLIRKAFLTLVVLFLAIVIFQNTTKQKSPQNSQFYLGSENLETPTSLPRRNTPIDLIFQEEIPKLPGKWAVVVKDLESNNIYQYNQNEAIPSASIYKLAVMWATFDATERGQMQKDDALKEQLYAMITISDNEAAVALAEKLGWTNITKLMQKEELDGFNLSTETPAVTAQSTADLFSRVWAKTAVSKIASEEMQNLLFAQKINDRIPKYLPQNARIGHKTGELDDIRHDAGIVIGQRGNYIFVFLSQTPSTEQAAETIALLSKKIFDLLETP